METERLKSFGHAKRVRFILFVVFSTYFDKYIENLQQPFTFKYTASIPTCRMARIRFLGLNHAFVYVHVWNNNTFCFVKIQKQK